MKQKPYKKRLLPKKICNAIVHRDYMGVHTQMKVYDDCCTTMASADFSRQALLRHGTSNTSSSPCVREISSDKGIVFPSYTHFIFSQAQGNSTDRSE